MRSLPRRGCIGATTCRCNPFRVMTTEGFASPGCAAATLGCGMQRLRRKMPIAAPHGGWPGLQSFGNYLTVGGQAPADLHVRWSTAGASLAGCFNSREVRQPRPPARERVACLAALFGKMPIAASSRRRHRQQLFVLRFVRVLPQPGRDEHEVVVHFVPQHDLAELRDEGAGVYVAIA